MEIPSNYLIADGPLGLQKNLNDLLQKSQQDPIFAREEHFILYQFGSQKSLIKVMTNQMPFRFIYLDLLGRPATIAVKEVIAQFLWDKCGEKERYLRGYV